MVVNRAEQRGILVMSDLVAEGARFCSAPEPFDAAQAAQSLEQLARLHVARDVVADTPSLPCRIDDLAVQTHFPQALVRTLLDDPRGEGLEPRTRDAGLLFAGMTALAARNAAKPQMLLHGDCHAGDIFWTADGPGFTDWQLVQRGHWALDVAYQTCAILPVAVEERDLLNHHLDRSRRWAARRSTARQRGTITAPRRSTAVSTGRSRGAPIRGSRASSSRR